MKRIGFLILCLLVVVIVIPFLIIQSCNSFTPKEDEPNLIRGEGTVFVNVLNTKDDSAMFLELDEYIKGVVAAEMPVTFHEEALKAQVVAARTYTLSRLEEFGGKPNDKHPNYDLCTDYAHCQAWISKDDRFVAWDENKELADADNNELWSEIENAVDSTRGLAITYNGELIDPLFHSSSGGQTENSEDYFTASLPYLRSVSSEYEKESPYISTNFDIKVDEFKKILEHKYSDIKFGSEKILDDVEILSRTDSGRVGEVKTGNKTISGREMREILGLRSSNFSLAQDGDSLVFTVSGYGHGVGLSQYGADGMAEAGHSFEEILQHYYTDTKLERKY